jgi:hypothetical protein
MLSFDIPPGEEPPLMMMMIANPKDASEVPEWSLL